MAIFHPYVGPPLLLAALLTTGASGSAPPQTAPQVVPRHGEFVPNPAIEAACRDRIERVREERGLPMLERDTASPDEPLLIAAVEKRIDGCSVMVMRHDTSDIRPLPKFEEGSAKLMPAR